MERRDTIYVAGHRGLAGSALLRQLQAAGHSNLVVRTHGELDLTDASAVERFFSSERPQYVFLAAAKVGGILANHAYPADFIFQNIAIQTNVLQSAWRHGVERLLFLGSSCIYPRDCPQPMQESDLLGGPLEPTNRPYAIAKIAGIEMCWALNRQHKTRFVAAMPTNLYGPGDNYDLQSSHVLPALIRKMHEAKASRAAEVTIWGTGAPRREFLYSDDMADACMLLMQLPDGDFDLLANPPPARPGTPAIPPMINIGCGEDLTVRELAESIASVVGFEGKLVFDATKPDGTPRKLLDISRIRAYGWRPRTPLRDGIALAYRAYLDSVKT